MAEFTFYRQQRHDGGIRTGLTLDDVECFHLFEPGTDDSDPALNWFVDVRGRGEVLPDDADSLRNWLIENAKPVQDSFVRIADEFSTGMDWETWPVRRQVETGDPNVNVEIVFSVSRRHDAREIGQILDNVGREFPAILKQLQPLVTH